MNNDWTYPFWFERCDDGKSWAFTMSGDTNDAKNLDVEELSFLFKNVNFGYKSWTDTIVKIGIDPDGKADFHFSDGTVSPSTAYLNESFVFLESVNLMCLGYLFVIMDHDEKISEWIKTYQKWKLTITQAS